MLLEIALIGLILGTLFLHPGFRSWFAGTGNSERRLLLAIVALMVVFHCLDFSRHSFPLVRWSMYSTRFDSQPMQWAKLQAKLQDGSTVQINPTHQFPSLNRNFAERFERLVSAAREGTITDLGREVFDRMLLAIAARFNLQHPDNPAVEIRACIEQIEISNRKTFASREWVTSVEISEAAGD